MSDPREQAIEIARKVPQGSGRDPDTGRLLLRPWPEVAEDIADAFLAAGWRPPACCCCGQPASKRGVGDPWEGRLDGYCDGCAENRCDASPDSDGGGEVPTQEAEAPQGLRAISYGGGRQSTALVVLAAQGVIDFPLAIFSNVGDRAENPDTIRYVAQHIVPWLSDQPNVELVQTRWIDRTGKERDLYDDLVNPDHRSIDIPVYMEGGAPGNRKCTTRYKIEVVGRELKKRGASPDNPCTVAVGFSADLKEIARVSSRRHEVWERPVYPLIEMGISTADCARIVADAGLPPAPKSSCWFCPFQRPAQWAEKRRDRPEQFAQSVELEDRLNAKRESFGKDRVYLSGTKRPLALLPEAPQSMFPEGPESCDDGYCWT